MKTRLLIPAVVFIAVFCLGMSGLGKTSERKFVHPKKNFKVTITDTENVKSEADLVTCEGTTKFTGYNGKSRIRVPFAKISRIELKDSDQRYKTATITFWDGSKHEIQTKKIQSCSGRTKLGEMFIDVRNIKDVVFEKGEFASMSDEDTGKDSASDDKKK